MSLAQFLILSRVVPSPHGGDTLVPTPRAKSRFLAGLRVGYRPQRWTMAWVSRVGARLPSSVLTRQRWLENHSCASAAILALPSAPPA
jgi:hypothetical protein